MNLAVNFFDLDRNPPFIVQLLLSDNVYWKPIRMDRSRIDEYAVAFSCDLITAACICDTLRTKDRNCKRYPTRVYLRTHKAWRKLPGAAVLTRVVDDKVDLNPVLFPQEPVPAVPRDAEPVNVGRRL